MFLRYLNKVTIVFILLISNNTISSIILNCKSTPPSLSLALFVPYLDAVSLSAKKIRR